MTKVSIRIAARPALASVQLRPLSVLLKKPQLVPAYAFVLSVGSSTMARAMLPVLMGPSCGSGNQFAPPLMLLYRPPVDVPPPVATYKMEGVTGSTVMAKVLVLPRPKLTVVHVE